MKYSIICSDCYSEKNQPYTKTLKSLLCDHQYVEHGFEYLFIIGGDGSFLRYVKPYLSQSVKIILINSGHLGFYSYIKDLKNFVLEDIFNEKNYINLDLLTIKHEQNTHIAINEFAFYSNFTTEISTYVNDVLLQTIHGNGVLVATPLGSTARNKSLGGAILMPNTQTLTINEVEAINNHYYSSLGNPVVIDNKDKICIKTTNLHKATLLIDGFEINVDEPYSEFNIVHNISKAKVLIRIDLSNWTKKLHDSFK